uniref:Uncharacterized protein n=1 Tax=Homalodisca liturata TaxID=320908 RepID=A0A1B6HEQ5_9HEMI
MKPALLLVAVAFGVLLVLPSSFGAPCKCSSKKELPARNCGEDDVTYYKRVFTVESSSECSVTKFYKSVFTQYSNEDKTAYVKRIDVIFGSVYKNLDCRVNIKRQDYLQKYYEYKFAKQSNENDEEYFERVLTRKDESEETYTCKCELLKKFVKKIDWSKVKIEGKSKKGFSLIGKIKSRSCGNKEVSELISLFKF